MKLRVRCLELDAGGKTIAIINSEDARELGVRGLERIVISKGNKRITAVANVSNDFVMEGDIVVYSEVKTLLGLKNGDFVYAVARPELESKKFIRKKIDGEELNYKEANSIVKDVVARNLSDLELAALITGLYRNGLDSHENYYFTKAFLETSDKRLHLSGTIVDKHSCGGVAGDKTSMLLVPIIAAAGLTIPKTSSRAITAPAGTADRVEAICPVVHDANKIKEIVKKTGGCMVWGGSLDMVLADDLLIQIEKPLAMDPLIVPSVISKKKAVGSKYVVIDIPTGPEAKFKTKEDAEKMAKEFINIGNRFGMKIECVLTRADQPIGFAIGPKLEAKEALSALMHPHSAPKDLVDKVTSLAGILLTMVKKGDKNTAKKILFSGKAEKKFREIIAAQGGNYDVTPKDLEKRVGKIEIRTQKSGYVSAISNNKLITLAKLAGTPKDSYSGIVLNNKIGSKVNKRELLYTIFIEKSIKQKLVRNELKTGDGFTISGKARKMVIEEIDHIKRK
ncbi:MAG: thymidine phosphorylase [Candidatus Aenigmatarchaeota archaeon]